MREALKAKHNSLENPRFAASSVESRTGDQLSARSALACLGRSHNSATDCRRLGSVAGPALPSRLSRKYAKGHQLVRHDAVRLSRPPDPKGAPGDGASDRITTLANSCNTSP